ncbi:MAG: hypothetical protein JXA60_04490 [Candidatus Coatesbacteria bacterium]|nr:hypothetical protein [Candidatus Coatesbacteria bacterium]
MVYKGRYYGWGWLFALLWLLVYFLWPFKSTASTESDYPSSSVSNEIIERNFN